jgi:cupin superfamily acireductone dioxygenase involved in methionine salvage
MPTGVSDKIFNTDSLTYNNYIKSDKDIGNSYGLSTANSVEKQQLDQLKTRLDQISQELADDTGTLNTDEIKVENQSTLQTQAIGNYLKEYENTNDKIKIFTSGMDGIIRDSDITVLKENYNYYFWSILAVGTVLVTMNVTKK